MAESVAKIGIISCSGEEIPEGTISRLATRRVLEGLRPQQTVTLCLPLFLAGEVGERRFAQEHPTITVDGCDKLCAKRGTERYSGRVASSLVVPDILGSRAAKCHRSTRQLDKSDAQAIWLVAERIAAEVDALAAAAAPAAVLESPQATSCGCSCGSPPPEGSLPISGRTVTVNGLPLIFDHLYKAGLRPGDGCPERILGTVRIYHAIEPEEDSAYREALAASYVAYCQRRERSLPADSGNA